MTGAIVLDIEGTTSSLSYVREHLFRYSYARIPEWISKQDAAVVSLVDELRDLAGRPDAPLDELAGLARHWIDTDLKAAPLKSLQGLIWQAGFAAGELTAHLYPDVPGALRTWQEQGIRLYVYSSGSVLTQRLWFAHTPYGDLTMYLSGYFDGRSAGPKRDPDSYRVITRDIGIPARQILFLSDTPAELDAARQAHWQTTQVLRSGDGAVPAPGHPQVSGLHQVAAGRGVA